LGRSCHQPERIRCVIVQGLVLIALAVALRPLSLAAEVKALIVAVGGVTGSFALAWLLIKRVPSAARIL
jgi:hypothetical protein